MSPDTSLRNKRKKQLQADLNKWKKRFSSDWTRWKRRAALNWAKWKKGVAADWTKWKKSVAADWAKWKRDVASDWEKSKRSISRNQVQRDNRIPVDGRKNSRIEEGKKAVSNIRREQEYDRAAWRNKTPDTGNKRRWFWQKPAVSKAVRKDSARVISVDEIKRKMFLPQEHLRKKHSKLNREIVVVTVFFSLLFLLFTGYFMDLILRQEDLYAGSIYNISRQDLLSQKIVRGSIQDRYGHVLVETVTGEDGEETRNYLYDGLFAHAIGYFVNGKSGLEAQYNYELMRTDASLEEQVVADFYARKLNGNALVTTLFLDLQKAAAESMGDLKGAVVALDPKTGEVLALYSNPGFNPNTLAEDWNYLVSEENTDSNFLNRATQGLYPPGSIFKILTALAYYREFGPEAVNAFEFTCVGGIEKDGYHMNCFNGVAHGWEDFTRAFANSCNSAFCELGTQLDRTAFREVCESCFFNESFLFQMARTSGSFALTEESDIWDILQTVIGQGQTLVTPLQMALITAGIANRGVVMEPRLVNYLTNAEGYILEEMQDKEYRQIMSPEEAAFLTENMVQVTRAGTGIMMQNSRYQAAVKTGTAEYITGVDTTHAWVTGFAPAEDPQIVVTVVLEDAGTGSFAGAKVADRLFKVWLLGEE